MIEITPAGMSGMSPGSHIQARACAWSLTWACQYVLRNTSFYKWTKLHSDVTCSTDQNFDFLWNNNSSADAFRSIVFRIVSDVPWTFTFLSLLHDSSKPCKIMFLNWTSDVVWGVIRDGDGVHYPLHSNGYVRDMVGSYIRVQSDL